MIYGLLNKFNIMNSSALECKFEAKVTTNSIVKGLSKSSGPCFQHRKHYIPIKIIGK